MLPLLALSSALLYGAGDFLGGVASRQMSTAVVVACSQLAGLVVLLVVIQLLPPADPTLPDIVWGAAAGLSGSLGVALLYRALAIGVMGVVAPVTAVCGVAIPVAVSLLRGVRPAPVTLAGIVLAILAIALVSWQTDDASPRAGSSRWPRGLGHALVSGVAIGVFYLLIAEAGAQSGLWPLVGARGVAVPLCILTAVLEGVRSADVRGRAVRTAVVAGVLDMSANVLFLLASRLGDLPVAVTLASLYPASTVLLARTVLGERLSRPQLIGMTCALVAVVLIVSGTP